MDFSAFSPTNQQLLNGLHEKGVQITVIPQTNIARLEYASQIELCVGGYTSLTSQSMGLLLSNKYFCKQLLLSHKFSTPRGSVFPLTNKREALAFARVLGFPVVLKQENSQEDIPSIIVSSESQFIASFESFFPFGNSVIVEECVSGEQYSICYFESGYLSVLRKGKSIPIESVPSRNFTQPDIANEQYQSVTREFGSIFRPIAKRLHRLLGHPSYYRFSCILPSPASPSPIILELFHSPGPHLAFKARKGRAEKTTLDLMMNCLFPTLPL